MAEHAVALHIVSSELLKNNNSSTFNPKVDGKNISSSDEFKVNKTASGYSVVFSDDTLVNINVGSLMSQLFVLLMNNLEGTLNIKMDYHFIDNDMKFNINEDALIEILKMDDILKKSSNTLTMADRDVMICYIESDSISEIKEFIEMDDEEDNNESDDDDTVEVTQPIQLLNTIDKNMRMYTSQSIDEEDEDDFDVDENVKSTLTSILGDLGLDDEDDDNKEAITKSKKKTKSYSNTPRSRVFKESKNPKKEFKRHGVIITRDKDDLERDQKVIKEFLKEFIPGKEKWVKEFRSDILKRWTNTYTIRAKDLKRIEKNRKKMQKDKERKKKNKEILKLTRNIFNVPISSWDDPNK